MYKHLNNFTWYFQKGPAMFSREQILEEYKQELRNYKYSQEFQFLRGGNRVRRRGSGTCLDEEEDRLEYLQKILGLTPEEIEQINKEIGVQFRQKH